LWIDYLDIPRDLTLHAIIIPVIAIPNTSPDPLAPTLLQQLWAKYAACLAAQQHITALSWQLLDWNPAWRRPNQTDIISLFISSTQWHNAWKKPFGDVVAGFPDMRDWLSRSPNAKSAIEVWSHPPVGGGAYRFKDLEDFIKGKFTGQSSTSPSKAKCGSGSHKKKSKDVESPSKSDSGKAGPSKTHR